MHTWLVREACDGFGGPLQELCLAPLGEVKLMGPRLRLGGAVDAAACSTGAERRLLRAGRCILRARRLDVPAQQDCVVFL